MAPTDALSNPRLRAFMEDLLGSEGMRVAELLMRKEEATDSQLAEELGQKPSHIRKVLYDLYEARIAEYHKEKDKETGWLTFYWHIPQGQPQHVFGERLRKELTELEGRLDFEQEHQFFVCPSGRERFDFGAATEHDFHCPEHGEILQQHDNTAEIASLMRRIQEVRAQTEEISE